MPGAEAATIAVLGMGREDSVRERGHGGCEDFAARA